MSCPRRILEMAAAVVALGLIAGLAACQTKQLPSRNFPPEKRLSLQPGGPHKGTADTQTVIFSYRYSIEEDQQAGRIMRIEGGIGRFKMTVDSLSLYINFLDSQGDTLKRRRIYALGNRQGSRGVFIRPTTTFATELAVPPETVDFAFNSRTRLSRGKK